MDLIRPFSPPAVLVVDDDHAGRASALALLNRLGVPCEALSGGAAAVSYYSQFGPRPLVLLKEDLPGSDGPQTLAALRSVDAGVRCCFMVASPRHYSSDVLRSFGALDVLEMPTTIERLEAALRTCGVPTAALPDGSWPRGFFDGATRNDGFRDGRRFYQDGGAARPLSVLVVEGHKDTAESFVELLRLWGHEATPASRGAEALAAAERRMPDVVLLHLRLPDMGGLDLARRIREQAVHRRPLLVATFTVGSQIDERRAREAGIDLYLRKPVELSVLESTLRRFADILGPCAEDAQPRHAGARSA